MRRAESHSRITYKGVVLDVYYEYHPEEPMVRYYSDGSGYPGSPESFEINGIMLGDYDITELLEDRLDDIEKIVFDSRQDDYDGDY